MVGGAEFLQIPKHGVYAKHGSGVGEGGADHGISRNWEECSGAVFFN